MDPASPGTIRGAAGAAREAGAAGAPVVGVHNNRSWAEMTFHGE